MRVIWTFVCLALGGCVDPGGEYNAFVDRLGDGSPSAVGADGGGIPLDPDAATCVPSAVAGDYRLALSVTLAPTQPIVAAISIEATEDPPTLAFSVIQPLSAADRNTPVGASFSTDPVDVAGGTAIVSVPGLEVLGAANPITGSDIAADVTLRFDICREGYLCGDVSGQVTQPLALDLQGSTFTLTPIDPPTEPPPIDCAGNLAEPLE